MADGGEGAEKRTCPDCGGNLLIRDHSAAEVICGRCGHVVEERIKDMGPEWRSFDMEEEEDRSRAGAPSTETMHDRGLSTKIGRTNRDAKGNQISPERRTQVGRMRKWDRRSRLSGKDRYIAKALTDISRICSHIAPSRTIRERASLLYKRASDADLVRGRKVEAMAAATVHATCKEAGTRKDPSDIADIAGANPEGVKRAYRLLVRELDLENHRTDPARYVSRICEALNPPMETKEAANEIARHLGNGGSTGTRSSRALAAGAVYMAGLANGEGFAEEEIAEPVGLSRPAVLRVVDELLRKAADGELPRFGEESEKSRGGRER